MPKLHYRHFPGTNKTPIIGLHGLFGSGDNLMILRQLELETWLLDLPNHGKSPHSDDCSFAMMAQAVIEFIEQRQLAEVVLFGHSLGGKVAMKVAMLRPDLLKCLIVEDIAPKRYFSNYDEYFDAFAKVVQQKPTQRQLVDRLMEFYIPETSIRQFLQKSLHRIEDSKSDNPFLTWQFNWQALQKTYTDWLESPIEVDSCFDKPTLFIGGTLSDYIQLDDHPLIYKHFAEAQIVAIDESGHWVHAEQAQRFLVEIERFLMELVISP